MSFSIVHKSATQVGIVALKNGNRITLHLGTNHNTGEAIMWQRCNNQRTSRITGKNIFKIVAELNFALCEDGAKWIEVSHSTVDYLAKTYLPK